MSQVTELKKAFVKKVDLNYGYDEEEGGCEKFFEQDPGIMVEYLET